MLIKKKNWKCTILCSTHYKIIMHSICAYVNIGWAQIERWYFFDAILLLTRCIPLLPIATANDDYASKRINVPRCWNILSTNRLLRKIWSCWKLNGRAIRTLSLCVRPRAEEAMTKLSWNVFNIDKAMKSCYVEKNNLK